MTPSPGAAIFFPSANKQTTEEEIEGRPPNREEVVVRSRKLRTRVGETTRDMRGLPPLCVVGTDDSLLRAAEMRPHFTEMQVDCGAGAGGSHIDAQKELVRTRCPCSLYQSECLSCTMRSC